MASSPSMAADPASISAADPCANNAAGNSTNARGFHDPESFITMIVLDRAGIAPDLPWAPAG